MIRIGVLFWVALLAGLGCATFAVSYSAQGLDDDLARVRRQTAVEQQEMRVLDAEWTYLNQPTRLEELNRRFLSLAPISPQQLSRTIAELPMRPVAPPPETVAAVAPATAPAPNPTAAPTAVPIAATAVKPPATATSAAPSAAERPVSSEPKRTAAKPALPRPFVPAATLAAAPQSLDQLFTQVAGSR